MSSGHAQDHGRRLLELQRERRLNDAEITELAGLSCHVVELVKRINLEIDEDGEAHIEYRFDLLNLGDKPQARMTREVWFEHTTGPLVVKPVADRSRATSSWPAASVCRIRAPRPLLNAPTVIAVRATGKLPVSVNCRDCSYCALYPSAAPLSSLYRTSAPPID